MNKKIQEQVLKDKELRKFIIQFVHYGHGNVGGRLLTKKIKCDGCEEDVNAIIEDISSRTIKLMEEVYKSGIPIDDIKQIALDNRNWTGFKIDLEEILYPARDRKESKL